MNISCSLPASDGQEYDLQKGKYVLYLYPKDMTSGCTLESQNFRDHKKDFDDLGFQILGLSKDSLASHEKFIQKENLNFPLLSDESTEFIQSLDAWKEKSMYGKKYFGIERSTFVIVDGEIVHQWRKVKVDGHVAEVLEVCKTVG